MKHKWLALLLAALTALSAPLLTSCQGKSAYEIAVENGFDGDVEDWLESLRGDDGKDGKDGADGKDGENGKDGADGKDGVDGEDGKDGSDGKDGADGGTYIPDSDRAYNLALLSSVSVYCTFTVSSWMGSSESSSAGSGVIYQLDKESGDAYIITNYHVVYYAGAKQKISQDINVFLYGMEYADYAIPATYVGGSMNYDIAVLKVSGNDLLKASNAAAITPADSNKIVVGGSAVAIGNPEAGGISVTRGIISVDSEELTMTAADERTEVTFRTIRIDAAVNSGNSGGGLFNSAGQLIGIVNAKIVADGIEGIAYAIPSNIAIGVAQNIIDNSQKDGYTDGVWKCLLGVMVRSTNIRTVVDGDSQTVNIHEDVVVDSINAGSIAEGALQVGDVVKALRMGDKTFEVTRSFVVVDAMLSARVGDKVVLTVLRNGVETNVEITITEGCISVYK